MSTDEIMGPLGVYVIGLLEPVSCSEFESFPVIIEFVVDISHNFGPANGWKSPRNNIHFDRMLAIKLLNCRRSCIEIVSGRASRHHHHNRYHIAVIKFLLELILFLVTTTCLPAHTHTHIQMPKVVI